MTPDVVVIGAGPAGAAVSIILAQQGYRVLLLDRATFPRDKPCAEYLSPACSPLLERLGVLQAVLAAVPQQLQGMRITDYRGQSCVGHFVENGQYLRGLALPRRVLDHLLVQRACSVGVELRTGFWVRQPLLVGKRVCGVSGSQNGKPMTVQAKLVIAADGLHSTLGRRLGVVQPVRWLQHIALVTHYAQVEARQPRGEMFLIPFGYIGLAPVTADLVNVSLVIRAQRLSQAQIKPEMFLEQTIHAHPELRQRFAHAVRMQRLLTTGPMAQSTTCPRHDGILFVGDAAGFFDPFTGQGIYLALHGAALAAAATHQALCTGDTSAQNLRHYFLTHRQVFRDKYRVSKLIQLGLRCPWLATRVIKRLAHNPGLADTVVGVTGDFLSPQAVLSWRFARRVLV
ncbi:MAG TPA: NAD(P)/FAD-dependent oxidoreductase [Candidatus Tectomicrobia bacterium]|jgi:flavin-dependent dehydrogenase